MKNKFSLIINDKQAQAIELFKTIKLQRTIVFEFDNNILLSILVLINKYNAS